MRKLAHRVVKHYASPTELAYINENCQLDVQIRNIQKLSDELVDKPTSVISFIGITNAGKSTIIGELLPDNTRGRPEVSQDESGGTATSADIHHFIAPLAKKSTSLFLDVEGAGGAQVPQNANKLRSLIFDRLSDDQQEEYMDKKSELLMNDIPRLTYFVSNVLVYVGNVSFAVKTTFDDVARFAKSCQRDVELGKKPALILVYNKSPYTEFDEEKSTKTFLDSFDKKRSLLDYFKSVRCIMIPVNDRAGYREQMQKLRNLIVDAIDDEETQLFEGSRWCYIFMKTIANFSSELKMGELVESIAKLGTEESTQIFKYFLELKSQGVPREQCKIRIIETLVAHVLSTLRDQLKSRNITTDLWQLQDLQTANDPAVMDCFARAMLEGSHNLKELIHEMDKTEPCTAQHPTIKSKSGQVIECRLPRDQHRKVKSVHESRPHDLKFFDCPSIWTKLQSLFGQVPLMWPGDPKCINRAKELSDYYQSVMQKIQTYDEFQFWAWRLVTYNFYPINDKMYSKCPICLIKDPIVSLDPCQHKFCKECFGKHQLVAAHKDIPLKCPSCDQRLKNQEIEEKALFQLLFTPRSANVLMIEAPLLPDPERFRVYTSNEIETGKTIGQGFFGKVKLAKVNGTTMVIKTFRFDEADSRVHDSFVSEAYLLGKMEHPNVVKCHGAVKFAGECGLVMERMHCSLDGFLCTTKYISLRQVFHFATEIIKGLDYIHDLHVGHRDIKPANVLLRLNDGLHVTKIADFGVSRELFLVGDVRESDTVTIVGTRGYMAPEIRPGRAYDPYLADVYSYGKLLQGLLGHCQSGESQPKTELQDLANKCSSIDPSSRPTSYRILRSLQGTETAFIREVAEFDRQNPPSPLDQEWIQKLRDNLSQPDDLTE